MVEDKIRFEAAVLAGGKSSRMGFQKTFAKLDGKPLIRWTIDSLTEAGTFDRIFIVTNHIPSLASLDLDAVADLFDDRGPLGGLHAALMFCSAEYLFLCACDMPFIEPKLVRLLCERAKGADVCIPFVRGEFEPLCATYRKRTVKAVERAIESGKRRVISFFESVRVRKVHENEIKAVDPALVSFFNINSPQDMDRARELLQKRNER